MMLPRFEIKIAIVGYVSVGKTTVLNALLGAKFGEVSMRRTTAGINYFHIIPKRKGKRKSPDSSVVVIDDEDNDDNETTDVGVPINWSTIEDSSNPRSAESTHAEIKNDNARLRATNTIEEKHFDVKIEQPICDMRNDTQLVIVDIPGVNEAGTNDTYKTFVAQRWKTFDCVIIVMDAVQGVNTEEQVQLLEFAKQNQQEQKDIPIIILGNKVDDPDDEEQQALVNEARVKTQQIFGVGCMEESLKKVLAAANDGTPYGMDNFTAFVPTSAIHAFIYRTASLLTIEQFKKLDRDLIERLGREEVGRFKWKKLSEAEKYEAAYAEVSNPSEYDERLEATNFDTFLKVLSVCIGGEETQLDLIRKQLQVSLKDLSTDPKFGEKFDGIVNQKKLIGMEAETAKDDFWKVYKEWEINSFDKVENELDPSSLAIPMSNLISYHKVCCKLGWNEEAKKAVDVMQDMVRRQLGMVILKFPSWNFDNWYGRVCRSWHKPTNLDWSLLSPHDWMVIASSINLMGCDMTFCELFGKEKVELDVIAKSCTFSVASNHHSAYGHYNNRTYDERVEAVAKALAGKEKDGKFVPHNPVQYNCVVQIEIPKLLSEPTHWGHVAWGYVKFLKRHSTDVEE